MEHVTKVTCTAKDLSGRQKFRLNPSWSGFFFSPHLYIRARRGEYYVLPVCSSILVHNRIYNPGALASIESMTKTIWQIDFSFLFCPGSSWKGRNQWVIALFHLKISFSGCQWLPHWIILWTQTCLMILGLSVSEGHSSLAAFPLPRCQRLTRASAGYTGGFRGHFRGC